MGEDTSSPPQLSYEDAVEKYGNGKYQVILFGK